MKTKTIEIPEHLDLNLEKLIELGVLTPKTKKNELTSYSDVQDWLKKNTDKNDFYNYYIGNDGYYLNKCLEPNLEALVKLINTAKYLNKDWLPGEKDDKYYILINYDNNCNLNIYYDCATLTGSVYFKTEELAKKAIEILGEDTIRKALTLNY